MAAQVVSYKLVLLGDAAVGKSSLVERFVRGSFEQYTQPTIGAAFLTQSVRLHDYTVKFEVWDTAGQERYRSLAPMYYRGAAAALVLYDISCAESFGGARTWCEELQRQGGSDIVICLVGNKSDLGPAKRKVPTEEAKAYAEENGCLFVETSAKTGDNVNEVFQTMAKKLPRHARKTHDDSITIISADKADGACCK